MALNTTPILPMGIFTVSDGTYVTEMSTVEVVSTRPFDTIVKIGDIEEPFVKMYVARSDGDITHWVYRTKSGIVARIYND